MYVALWLLVLYQSSFKLEQNSFVSSALLPGILFDSAQGELCARFSQQRTTCQATSSGHLRGQPGQETCLGLVQRGALFVVLLNVINSGCCDSCHG